MTDKTTKAWLEILQSADIAVKPCHTLETLPHDPHLEAVGLLRYEQHPTEGKTVAIRSTISFDDAYPPLRSYSQPRGWETLAVLEEIGYSSSEIEGLLVEGAAVANVVQQS
ncbi:CoA transferase [Paraburkholderia fungorum]|uniref:CoA transferase n=1 Tax=Paraburkholderia fungorum TaxID=134537 RepID=UPI0038BD9A0E